MLQLINIRKEYRTGGFVQKALDGVSVSFRDNEFVAILGPSGSGKSTLLNIIGGLDRYDEGDLIINNISTKKYKDADWDSYRNHTIGFVFQSYNLIPHQTILSNVELALTISGVSKTERRKRAEEALEKVGLGDQIHKKPNQLSGGQMQRVAVARALVNNPDILLADEPTGALDTKTSLQIMDLLKEVAKDRLVIMVTHNPDLAEQYATRIVRIQDGQIISDTEPYEPKEQEVVHKNLGRASMSLLTSLSLSFQNLLTKRNRTILTAFAGSIGIIGIALILALSTGANIYIKKIEENALSEYPISISSAGINASQMFNMAISSVEARRDNELTERKALSMFFAGTDKNDLESLKKFFDSDKKPLEPYVKAVEYTYDVKPIIYKINDGKYRKVNPDQTFSAYSSSLAILSNFTSMSTTSVFNVLPGDKDLYFDQYELKAGRWPENKNEIILVTISGTVSDTTLYAAGMKDPAKLDEMMKQYMNNEPVDADTEIGTYHYVDFLGLEFKVLNAFRYYEYDPEYGIYVDRSDNEAYMNRVLSEAETLTVVGVIEAKEDATNATLYPGFSYTPELVIDTMKKAMESDIVKAQLADPDINVLTGKPFGEKSSTSDFDLFSFVKFDESVLKDLFKIDPEEVDLSQIDLSDLDFSSIDFSSVDMSRLSQAVTFDFSELLSEEELQELLEKIGNSLTTDDVREILAKVADAFGIYLQENYSEEMRRAQLEMAEFAVTGNIPGIVIDYLTELYKERGIKIPEGEAVRTFAENLVDAFVTFAENYEDPEANLRTVLEAYLETGTLSTMTNEFLAEYALTEGAFDLSEEEREALSNRISERYTEFAEEKGYFTSLEVDELFDGFLSSDVFKGILEEALAENAGAQEVERILSELMEKKSAEIGGQVANAMAPIMAEIMAKMTEGIRDGMEKALPKMFEGMGDLFKFDEHSFDGLVKFEMDAEQLMELFAGMFGSTETSYWKNLSAFNYGTEDNPSSVSIYPKDFEAKESVLAILDGYNKEKEEAGEKDKIIRFSDYVGNLMSSVTTIVDVISYVLIAFVAISLIVSSIMIGIITYVSVIERTREIGILRALGASKRNISNVFNAETFIIGLLAGLFGVGITLLIMIPGNAVLKSLVEGQDVRAVLEPGAAVALVVISIILTLIGGLIPARKAARMDPVTALRTE